MLNLEVFNIDGKVVGNIELPSAVFEVEPNTNLMHKMIVNYLANQRQGTQSALTRAEVAGGGRKPWRQKGTGRARQGSTRSPQWRHGGVVFAPKPRDYGFKINRKERKLALKSALSTKALAKEIIVLDSLVLDEFNTKKMVNIIEKINAPQKSLVILDNMDLKVSVSARNIPGLNVAGFNSINVYNLLKAKNLIITKPAIEKIGEVYA